MKLTPLKNVIYDIQSVSGTNQVEHRDRMLISTANLLKECSAIVDQSARYFTQHNANTQTKGGKATMIKGFNMPYLPPIPAEKNLRIEREARTPDRMPLQVHLISTIARAINNACVELGSKGDVDKQAYAQQGRIFCEGLIDVQAILEMKLMGTWRPGINYNDW